MEKFKPQSPDLFLKKDADMSPAKFGHLNAIVEEVNTLSTNVATNAYTYIEVPITSAQILNMWDTAIDLLPTLASNQYYIFDIVLEYTAGTTPYVNTDPWGIYGSDIEYVEYSTVSLGATNEVYRISSSDQKFPDAANREFTGTSVKMYTNGSANPTAGDGTILAKIWYKVRTFGSEL